MTKPVDTPNITTNEMKAIVRDLEVRDDLISRHIELKREIESVLSKISNEYTYKHIAKRHNRAEITINHINMKRRSKEGK